MKNENENMTLSFDQKEFFKKIALSASTSDGVWIPGMDFEVDHEILKVLKEKGLISIYDFEGQGVYGVVEQKGVDYLQNRGYDTFEIQVSRVEHPGQKDWPRCGNRI